MKHLTLSLLLLLCACNIAAKTRKALFLIVDGIPADVIERLHVPAIYNIAANGGYARAHVGGDVGEYTQTPTISAVGYTTVLTGTWFNKHNVAGNSNIHENYNYWTLFRLAKEQPKPYKTAIYSSWTDNRTILLGEGKPETNHLKIDYVFDGLDLDTINYPRKPKELQVFDYDQVVSAKAAEGIRRDAPDLSWVYLWYPDDAAHLTGNGKYFDTYVLKAGEQIQKIWEAIQYREQHFNEEWMMVVTTDHGRTNSGYGHGGQSCRERTTWIATNRPVASWFKSGRLAAVDIAPSISRFMGFTVPRDNRFEWDGTPFIGPVDVTDFHVMPYDKEAWLTWTCTNPSAKATIYLATDNSFKTTGRQTWQKVAEVPAKSGRYTVDLSRYPASKIYKFVIDTPNGSLNCWLVK